jgi:hypothetical protein
MPKQKANSRSYSNRDVDSRETKPRFLIVCEGSKTERYYFQKFRVSSKIPTCEATDPLNIVQYAQELANEAKSPPENDPYSQVWCVFDRDPGRNSTTAENFNGALQKASALGFNVAYSNECFEVWFILHFEYLHTGLPRKDYKNKLSNLLGQEYQKNDPEMYDKLLEKQPEAIKHAQRLLESYNHPNPEKDNPSTTFSPSIKPSPVLKTKR